MFVQDNPLAFSLSTKKKKKIELLLFQLLCVVTFIFTHPFPWFVWTCVCNELASVSLPFYLFLLLFVGACFSFFAIVRLSVVQNTYSLGAFSSMTPPLTLLA